MSIKQITPIFLLLILVIGLVACQPTEVNQAAEVTTDNNVAETVADVEVVAPVEAEVEEMAVKEDPAPSAVVESEKKVVVPDVAAPSAEFEPEQAAVPEFVPPKPVQLSIEPEALAFAMGNPDAPVQIIEFTDYECPFCQRYALETMPTLVENLVESGRVFYAIKDLPLDSIHPEARSASVAARCAGEQDAYLPMHDAIFATQTEWQGKGEGAEVIFADLAAELSLDADTFTTCVANGQQTDNVQANVEEAMSLGVNGTPFFFINGYALSGGQPYEAFEAGVELAESGQLDDVITAQARQAYEAMLAQQAPPPPAEPVEIMLDDAYAIGDPDAPVTIIEYTDFQCPFCARHTLETFAQIKKNMVESGQVRYIFKDLPLTSIHPQATLAAEAARCAGAQDTTPEAYVMMHNALFENQQAWSGQANATDLFADYATEMGLDRDNFATCIENREFGSAVQADMQEAMQLGITGTPAFVINGHLVSGAQPYEVFEQAVEFLIAETSLPAANN